MGNTMLQVTLSTLCPLTAVFSTGIVAGFLSAVTFLDTRTFRALVQKKDAETIKKMFPIWWPFGKAFMVPSLALNLLTHLSSYAATGEKMWIFTGLVVCAIGPYTAFVMKEDIEILRGHVQDNTKEKLDDDEIYTFTTSFCKLHHARLVLALIAYGTSLYLIA